MRIRNFTPFSPFYFKCEDHEREEVHVFILKGTFRIEGENPLIPVPDQEPVLIADEYYGEPLTSSVRRESDICPHKPNTDIIIIGDAIAPHGRPARAWSISVDVESDRALMSKKLSVYGPRWWRAGLLGWSLSEPEPCLAVPLRYEFAFGGTALESQHHRVEHEPNPIGLGFSTSASRRRVERYPAPQIESPLEPVVSASQVYSPQGLGVVTKAWPQRRVLAGTYDDEWLKTVWPGMPPDFDFAYYNGAPQDQQIQGYLRGNERFTLVGMTVEPSVSFSLPSYTLALMVTDTSGDPAPILAGRDSGEPCRL